MCLHTLTAVASVVVVEEAEAEAEEANQEEEQSGSELEKALFLSPVQQPLKLCGITTHHTELSTRQQAAAAASIPECATLQQTVREREKKNSHTHNQHTIHHRHQSSKKKEKSDGSSLQHATICL